MAKLPHANSRRMYSWWWDSHISPKNSRWLQENLTDMDVKVKSMIKLIEEDADSFARRAEMYYKKRPELMKMVEEFYRAYRALAERYDQSTRALLQASRTMTESYPNQVPSGLTEDELAKFANENYPQATDDQYREQKKGLKQFNDSFGSRDKVRKGLNFDEAEEKEGKSNERAVKLEKEIQTLKEALAKFEAEKESSLAHRELEIIKVKEDTKMTKADDEVESLKMALKKLEVEKGTTLAQYKKCLEKIEDMEGIISRAEKQIIELNARAQKVEAEAQTLKLNLATMESEKATFFTQCSESLEKISTLENKLVFSEEKAKKLNERAEEAEAEAEILKKAIAELGVEREANAVKYQQCLHTISTLETKILCAEEEVQMLNGEREIGDAKLKGAEEKCVLLEKSNKSLHSEFESLKLKIGVQSEELKEKEREMGILWTSVQEERFRFVEAETAFQTLQILHAQTEEELKFNSLELQKRSLIVSDLETRNQSLLNESLKIKDENESLNDLNLKYLLSIKDMQNEIKSLLESKRKLEEDVELRVDQRNALQQDIYRLKEELNDLNKNYFASLDRVEGLQDENLNLKEIQEKEMREKLNLLGKVENLENVVGENTFLEKSLSDLRAELEGARKEILELGKSFKSVSDEKSTLDLEKAAIVTQLQVATENLVKLSEKNTFMEHSVSNAHDKIEGQKIRLNSLEISCQILENEKSNLVNEKVSLASQVEITRQRLEGLEKEYRGLEEKYSVLEKEKESALSEVVELQLTLKESKQKEENQMIEIENLHGKVLDMQKTSVILKEENSKLVGEKTSLVNSSQTLQLLHAQTEEELKSVALELQNRSSDLETHNQSLLNESLKIKEENENLHELNLTSMLSIKDMQNEIISLLEKKRTLEEEVELRLAETNALQQDIFCLKKKLDDLNKKYLAMLDQVEAVGFNPECFESAVKSLQDENLNLKKIQEKEMREKLYLLGKIENLEKVVEKNALLEKSLSDLREDLEGARKEILGLEKSFIFVSEEKSTLGLEKAAIVTQLQVATENLGKLSEKNTFMENSLSDAHGEIEGLKIRLKSLEESCQILENEKSDLINEKGTLVSQVDITKQRLEDLGQKYRGLEENYSVLEKGKESALCEVVKLQSIVEENKQKEEKQMIEIEDFHRKLLDMKKTSVTSREENSKLLDEKISLVNAFQTLQFLHAQTEEELKSVASELQKRCLIVSDLETHYQSLQDENLNLKEIQEKEMKEKLDLLGKVENLENVVEKNAFLEKSLSDLSANLEGARKEILALEKSFIFVSEEKSALDLEKTAIVTQLQVAAENLVKLAEKNTFIENSVSDAHDEIEGLKKILKSFEESCQNLENEKLDLINEKISLVSQVEITREILEDLEKIYRGLEEKYSVLEKEKESAVYEVVEMQLTVNECKQKEKKQMIEIEDLRVKVLNMQKTSVTLMVENSKLLDEKISLVKDFVDLQEKNNTLEGESLLILDETAYLSYLSEIFKTIINEKSLEIEELQSTVNKIQRVSVGFEEKVSVMEGKLEQVQLENMDLNKLLKKTEDNLSAITIVNGQLNLQIENGKDLLCQKKTEISEEKCKIAGMENEKSELQNLVAKLKEKNGEIKMFLDEGNRERNNEVVFWESEAAKLVSELHTSCVIRALLEEKFRKLIGVLKSLDEETNSKDKGIELLTEKISLLENENGEIGALLTAFCPVINSLKDCICSLENKTSLHKELQNENHENVKVGVENHEGLNADQKETDKLSDLQDMETRVKAVEITVIKIISKLETATRQLEELGSKSAWSNEKAKPVPVNSESEKGISATDIMFDQVSESSSYGIGRKECITPDKEALNGNEKITRRNEKEVDFDSGVTIEKELGVGKLAISNRFSLPNQELDKTKILQRLNSDSQKLANLQITVQDLKMKVEMSEKRIEGKSFGSESVGAQLVKAEEDIMQLFDANGKLMKNVDNSDDVKSVVESEENRNLRKKFSEQARKVSERIGQLQLEVQKIQFFMLKIDGENGNDRIKRKSEITEAKKRTSLRDYLGLRSSNRKRKRSFCGCVHPPSTAD